MVSVETLLERRIKGRLEYPFKIMHARFQFPGIKCESLIQGEIVNVSAIGVLFETSKRYDIDNLVRVEIRLGSWDQFKIGYSSFQSLYQGEPFVALGKVVRVTEKEKNGSKFYEVAVNYVSVDEGHQQAVSKFIRKFKKNR